MGNKHPTEYNGEHCISCGINLPRCTSFDHIENTVIDGRRVYVFNGGQYYRWQGWDGYYQCRNCFFKPMREREEQKRREEEERRRKREEEERRLREQREREASLKQANENAEELERDLNAWNNKNINKLIDEDMQQRTTSKFDGIFGEDEVEESDENNSFNRFYYLFYNLYGYELDYLDLNNLTSEKISDLIDPLQELIREDWLGDSPPNEDLVITVQMFAKTIFMASLKDPSREKLIIENGIDLLILKITESAKGLREMIQFTFSLLTTVQDPSNSLAKGDIPISHLRLSLEEKNKGREGEEEMYISKTDARLLDFIENLFLNSLRNFPESQGNSVTLKISSLLIEHSVVDFEYKDCSLKNSFAELVRNRDWNAKSVWILLRGIIQQCTSIKEEIVHYCEAFHLISAYYIGPNQILNGKDSLLQLAINVKPEILTNELREFTNKTKDQIKDLNLLFEEIHKTNLVDSHTLESVKSIVSDAKRDLQSFGYPKEGNEMMAQQFETTTDGKVRLSPVSNQKIRGGSYHICLTILSCAVYKINGWWPRDTQLISCCILMLSDSSGRLLEMSTGEGKSCVVAMFAVWLACKGKYVDIITSSPILAQRDVQEWTEFYKIFQQNVTNNVNKKDDKERKTCYEANIVYGTVANFASDTLREEFHMKDIRPSRRFDSVIVDEVDSMLLDQGIQLTYLPHETPGLHHLNPVLAMVWCSVSQFTPLKWETGIMWCGPPQPFFKAMYDAIDPTVCGVTEPLELLLMGETHGLIPEGFTERYEKAVDKSTKENAAAESKQELLAQITVETIIKCYTAAEEYLPCNFILYALDEENNIMQVDKPYRTRAEERVNVSILIGGPGVCCILTHSEEEIRGSIVERIKQLVLPPEDGSKSDDLMANLPKFLRPFIEKRLSIWVQNAFYAMLMQEGREYLVKGDNILPIDYRSTGIVQLNRKWSNGLHQFLQMKHKLQLNPLSVVTNFISNVAFFKRYGQSMYGMTGTLGNQIDHDFLTTTYDLKLCEIPTFSARKLFEYDGILASNRREWEKSIVESLKEKISSNVWRGKGRAALLICEDINSAKELCKLVSEQVSTNVKLYIRSDTDQLNVIHHKLEPQEIIVATNLAGRGTNIKVEGDVNDSGGLFVLVTFLPQNARVERQAFGRTARKGDPGSCQIIVDAETLPQYLTAAQSIPSLTFLRDESGKQSSLQDDIHEVELKEKLFAQYCEKLKFFQDLKVSDELRKNYVITLNEFWGFWLLKNSDKFDDTPLNELIDLLKQEVDAAIRKIYHNESATQNIYPLIRFGNEVLLYPYDSHLFSAYELFSRAIAIDPDWAAIAYYNRAYCTIQKASDDYINHSIEDLNKALESLKKHKEQDLITLQLINTAKSYVKETEEENPLSKQISTKFQIYNFFQKNIQEDIDNLNKYKDDDVEAVEKSVFSLITDSDPRIHAELYFLWQNGLINVYSIKKKPRFCWEGLVVFILGALQVVAGIALTVLSAGTLSNIGMALIGEGISDMIDGVIGMATGEFSWEEWAISKAIGITTSLIGFGIGKIMSKGFKAFKLVAKGLSKELKALPKLARSQIKDGLTQVMKENMKNAAKYAGKELAEEGILRGLQFAEDKIMGEFLDLVEDAVESLIEESVHNSVFNGGLGGAMDELVLSQIGGIANSFVLTERDGPSQKLQKTILDLGSKLLDSHMKDLAWQKQLNSALHGTLEKVKSRVTKEGKLKKYKVLFEIADAIHMGALAGDAIYSIQSLINEFDVDYTENIHQFMKTSGLTQSSPIEHNDDFTELKTNIANALTKLLSHVIVTVVDQKFTSHIVSRGEKLLNGKIVKYVGDKFLKGSEIEDKLKAGQASVAISAMSTDSDVSLSSRLSYKYANDIKDSTKPGSILDLRILSEKLGVKVSILEPLDNNKFRKMLNISPDSANEASPTLHLVYRSASDVYPDGHYDVLKDGKILEVDNENKNCAYHALSKALYPDNTEEENRKKAKDLRALESEELMTNSGKWNNFILMKDRVQSLTCAMWYLGIAGAKGKRKILEDPKADPNDVAEVGKLQKVFAADVTANLDAKYQKVARDRWGSVVVEDVNTSKSNSVTIKMQYSDKGNVLTNQQLFQTLSFYHEKGSKNTAGKLNILRIGINIGGDIHHFVMKNGVFGQRQIFITTLNDDYPLKSTGEQTKMTNSYTEISNALDSVDGMPKDTTKLKAYEKQKGLIIKERAKMISQAITSTDTNQPDFNKTYLSAGDSKKYPYFNLQQKRSAVTFIAITQVSEPSPPDHPFNIILRENAKKTAIQLAEDRTISKTALYKLFDTQGAPVKAPKENAADFTDRKDAFVKQREEAIAERAVIITKSITTGNLPTFKETYTCTADGKKYDCFEPGQVDAAKFYIHVKQINEHYHKESDPNLRTPINELKKSVTDDLMHGNKKKGISVPTTGRLPGTDKHAINLLNLMNNSDIDFKTMFSRTGGIPVYAPVTSVEYGREEFYNNS